MTEAASATSEQPAAGWTCARCEVTVSFSHEVERPRLPSTWSRENGELYCLGCRREMAGDAGVALLDEGASRTFATAPDARDSQALGDRARIDLRVRPREPLAAPPGQYAKGSESLDGS